jgi:glycosyltransferase involved in cell wall biosynthesis
MIITVLFYVFVAVTIIQVLYYLSFSVFAFAKKRAKENQDLPPISVIICAKNEVENLRAFLPYIISQEYSTFEIVLINDASTDDTLEIMQEFEEIHQNIRVVNVNHNEAFWGSKKYALTLGIKAASHEHLLFTDADCKPVSNRWIEEMARQFSTTKQLVLGYGRYKKVTNSFSNLLVRYETLLTAVQYFSYAYLGNPYMGVGRNLAYTKSAFFKVNGFVKHLQVRSGDDDLFVQEVANKNNTAVCFSEDSFTESIAPESLAAWFRQKRRHISTAKHYRFKYQFLLGVFFVSKFLFFALFGFLIFNFDWKALVALLSFYYLIQFLVIGFSAKKLRELRMLFFLPFLEISLLIFQFVIFMANIVSKPNHWK